MSGDVSDEESSISLDIEQAIDTHEPPSPEIDSVNYSGNAEVEEGYKNNWS